jgi:hypothetical protein
MSPRFDQIEYSGIFTFPSAYPGIVETTIVTIMSEPACTVMVEATWPHDIACFQRISGPSTVPCGTPPVESDLNGRHLAEWPSLDGRVWMAESDGRVWMAESEWPSTVTLRALSRYEQHENPVKYSDKLVHIRCIRYWQVPANPDTF